MRRAPTTQACAVAKALDVIGDYWCLMVLREALRGTRRFDDFLTNTGAATNVLSARLAHLVGHEVLTKQKYQSAPDRYEYVLTPKGRALEGVLKELLAWGLAWLPAPEPAEPAQGP